MAFLTRLLATVTAALLTITPVYTQAANILWPKNPTDLAILPEYCKGTQFLRDVSKLPMARVKAYYAEYGPTYNHLHHYCGALFAEFNADQILDKGPRLNAYNIALDNLDYVLKKDPPASFPLLPEIHTSRGRILLKMGRPGEAIAELNKVIEMKPDYEPAYIELSEYYLTTGKKQNAISILEKGVENNPSPSRLLKRLEKLGKPFKGTPGSALARQQATDSPPSESTVSPPAPSGSKGSDQPAPSDPSNGATGGAAPAIGKPGNPYCRFCP